MSSRRNWKNWITSLASGLAVAWPATGFSVDKGKTPEYDIVAAATAMGNGEIYSGGDPRYVRLVSAREQLNQALSLITAGVDSEGLCSPSHCDAGSDKNLCHILQSLTTEQRNECRRFLTDNAAELAKLDTEAATPFRMSAVPLTAPGASAGSYRSVSAITRRGLKGPIIFHQSSIGELGQAPLLALLTHELGHKLSGRPWATDGISDEKPTGHFKRGRDFLDAAGAAIGLYAPEYASPTQQPPPAPAGVSEIAACGIANDRIGRVFLGWAADVESRSATSEYVDAMRKNLDKLTKESRIETALQKLAQQQLSGDAARKQSVTSLFEAFLQRKATAEEQELMVQRLSTGETPDAVAASILGSDDYAATRGAATADRFVSIVYLDLFGRNPTQKETSSGMVQLAQFDKASWSLAMLGAPEAVAQLVKRWYLSFLNRVPTSSELQAAASRMHSGESWDSTRAAILAGAEYQSLQQSRWKPCTRSISSSSR